jgi:hypothetical protein
MRKTCLLLSLVLLTTILAATPASACTGRCHPSLGCIYVEWITYADCYNSAGGACIDVPVSGCTATKEKEAVALAEIFAEPAPEPAACTAAL